MFHQIKQNTRVHIKWKDDGNMVYSNFLKFIDIAWLHIYIPNNDPLEQYQKMVGSIFDGFIVSCEFFRSMVDRMRMKSENSLIVVTRIYDQYYTDWVHHGLQEARDKLSVWAIPKQGCWGLQACLLTLLKSSINPPPTVT